MKSLTAVRDNAIETAIDIKDAGVEKAGKLTRELDRNVRHNPWPHIAGAAAVGFLFGYILGLRRQ